MPIEEFLDVPLLDVINYAFVDEVRLHASTDLTPILLEHVLDVAFLLRNRVHGCYNLFQFYYIILSVPRMRFS